MGVSAMKHAFFEAPWKRRAARADTPQEGKLPLSRELRRKDTVFSRISASRANRKFGASRFQRTKIPNPNTPFSVKIPQAPERILTPSPSAHFEKPHKCPKMKAYIMGNTKIHHAKFS